MKRMNAESFFPGRDMDIGEDFKEVGEEDSGAAFSSIPRELSSIGGSEFMNTLKETFHCDRF
jgi:hypothetical protein